MYIGHVNTIGYGINKVTHGINRINNNAPVSISVALECQVSLSLWKRIRERHRFMVWIEILAS